MMRIITGRARGTHLLTLPDDRVTRPTTERAKEAVFSMIQFRLAGRRVLDLFAGSGQMGLEAVSRGAGEALFADASGEAIGIVRQNIERTHLASCCTAVCADYTAVVGRPCPGTEAQFGLVILDPPYAAHLVCPALRLLAENGWLTGDALLICESAEENIFENDPSLERKFTVLRHGKYAAVHMTLLEYAGGADARESEGTL